MSETLAATARWGTSFGTIFSAFLGINRGVEVRGSVQFRVLAPTEATGLAETASLSEAQLEREPAGLVSLLGKYDNDPSWEDFPAFLERYRNQIDEMNK